MPSLRSKAGARPIRTRTRRRTKTRRPLSVQARVAMLGTLAAVLIGVWWGTRPPDPREGSETVEGSAVAITRTPSSYAITYRIEDHAGGGLVVSTDRVAVRRPFDSFVESWAGPPPGTRRLSRQVTRFTNLTTQSGSDVATSIAAPPALAGSDLRLEPALADALQQRSVARRERRRVYGRDCQVYRAGGPVNSGDLRPYAEGTKDFTDVCVDAAGLVLEEAWTEAGELLRRRVAVSVRENPRLEDDMFVIENARELPPQSGGGSVRRLTPDSHPPGVFWTLPAAPDGFEFRGRYAVARGLGPQATDPTQQDSRIASVMDVYVKGAELFLVDRGGSVRVAAQPLGVDPFARKADLGPLGEGDLIVGLRGNEVRVQRDNGTFVRLNGTLDPERLIELARTMTSSEGENTLTCLNDAGAAEPCQTPAPPASPAPEPEPHEHD